MMVDIMDANDELALAYGHNGPSMFPFVFKSGDAMYGIQVDDDYVMLAPTCDFQTAHELAVYSKGVYDGYNIGKYLGERL